MAKIAAKNSNCTKTPWEPPLGTCPIAYATPTMNFTPSDALDCGSNRPRILTHLHLISSEKPSAERIEVARDDGLTEVGDQPLVERDVVQRQQPIRQEFARHEQMAKVGAREF